MLRQVGNFGEVSERCPDRVPGLERGQNRIGTEGGLLMTWLWQQGGVEIGIE
ncbi:MAG: hypothetical protein K2X74_04085 [Acetobacteraceae bacterium]|nr:hypothetical protein [Acetobacteraceae bacterium]